MVLGVAQYRQGRQADALDTVRRARGLLAAELGLDPCIELAELEQAILRQDPSLLSDGVFRAASTECPYFGLPPAGVGDAERYFGREQELAGAVQALEALGVLLIASLAFIHLWMTVGDAIHDRYPGIPSEALYYAIPVAAGAMLVRFILTEELALFFGIILSVLAGVMQGNSLSFGLYALVGSLVAADRIKKARDRLGIFKAGLVTSFTRAPVKLGFDRARARDFNWLFTTDRFWGYGWLAALHEGFAWGLAGLVALHVAGVLTSGYRHRENLVAAMFHGRKRRRAIRNENRS